LGEQVTFSVNVFPSNATYTWTLDGLPLSNTDKSYVYTAAAGNHTLTVKAKQALGTDTQTWNITTPSQPFTWNKTFGGPGEDWANSVQQTSDGGYILAGFTESFGAGSYDVWLIKANANGDRVWDKTFGGSGDDRAQAVQQTSDGGYILAGYTSSFGAGSSDAWLIKTDANGIEQWDKTFGGTDSEVFWAVQQTSDGGYILAGGIWSNVTLNDDAWLLKTDANGNKIWDKTYVAGANNEAYDVHQTSDGGYILAAYTYNWWYYDANAWLIKTDAYGEIVWDKTFGGPGDEDAKSVQQTKDGGYIMAGLTSSFGAGSRDTWLIKTDTNGIEQWDKTFGGSITDWANAVQQTNDEGYILAGVTESFGAGYRDAWLIKTDANGDKVWDKTFGGSDLEFANDVQQTSDGGYILAGLTYSFGAGNGDAVLIKTDAFGNAPATPTP
jgi:hypothetical protein